MPPHTVFTLFRTIFGLCTLLLFLGIRPMNRPQPYVMLLGIAQDAGYPQAGCEKSCCKPYWQGKAKRQLVTSLALIDPIHQKAFLIDATPDFPAQLQLLRREVRQTEPWLPDGILLTHAHFGHYAGLLHLGREAIGAKAVPVFALPKMRRFLASNGPWEQLVSLKNIVLRPLQADSSLTLSNGLKVRPILVPHRDEYSETVGFRIEGLNRKLLFIPDIDKWSKWNHHLKEQLAAVDYALLDGTFYQNGELPNRDMSEVPHPFVAETMQLLSAAPLQERQKVFFIHLNHTNPLLRDSKAKSAIRRAGFGLGYERQRFSL